MANLIILLVLFFAGAALLAFEVITPGFGVCGISGLVLLVVSVVLTLANVPFGIYIVAGEIVILAVLGFAVYKYVKRRQIYGKIILTETLNVDAPDVDARFYIGKEGRTKTPLKPVGDADFNGVTLEVYSDGGFINADAKIKVFDVRDNKLYVKEIKN